MAYELLVIADGQERGRIVHTQPSPATWGRKEGPPRFTVVTANLPDEANLADCRWDFDGNRLVGNPQPKCVTRASQGASEIAVVVACHEPYLDWLPGCLDSIDAQGVAGQRILLLDGCEQPRWLMEYAHWQVVCGEWGNPGSARNSVVGRITSEWVVFFDADNLMVPGYLEDCKAAIGKVRSDVGVLYSKLQHVDENLIPLKYPWEPHEYDYWKLRKSNFIDTSSCWRVAALKACGLWQYSIAIDDWATALTITQHGWKAKKINSISSWMRIHSRGQRRTLYAKSKNIYSDVSWERRTFAVVTLLAPNRQENHLRWLEWLKDAELPPQISLIVVDNRNCGKDDLLLEKVRQCRDWPSMHIITDRIECPGKDFWNIHSHVARLYRRALVPPPADLILTLEDDVEAPFNALRKLHEAYEVTNRVGAVSSVYACRRRPDVAIASLEKHAWNKMPKMADVPNEQHEVGLVGGGCTLWAGWALQQAMPIEPCRTPSGGLFGWDGALCRQIRAANYSIMLDGRVRCEHHTESDTSTKPEYDGRCWWEAGGYYR